MKTEEKYQCVRDFYIFINTLSGRFIPSKIAVTSWMCRHKLFSQSKFSLLNHSYNTIKITTFANNKIATKSKY